MKRVLCIWLPRWALERPRDSESPGAEHRGPAALIVLYEARAPRPARVVCCSAPASARGVRPGMSLVEAAALICTPSGTRPGQVARFPQFLLHEPQADREALVTLAQECHRFSPTVSLDDSEHPAALFLDVTSSAACQGGEAALAACVVRELAARGLSVRVAVADTLAGAWAIARWSTLPVEGWKIVAEGELAAALAPLPVAALRLPEDTLDMLARLGLRTVGQVAALPRSALPSRWGRLLIDRLDQAFGRVAELGYVVAPAEPLRVRHELEYPLTRLEPLAELVERLLRRLTEPLRRQGQGLWQLRCELHGQRERPAVVELTLFRPVVSARYLRELLELRWEKLRLREPIVAVEIVGLQTAPLGSRQGTWLADESTRRGELGELVDRLTNRLGRSAVWTPELVHEAQPELAYGQVPLVERRTRSTTSARRDLKRSPAAVFERPLRLLRAPRPLEVIAREDGGAPLRFIDAGQTHEVTVCDGPERIETGWWRGAAVRRDYYRVTTHGGQKAWLFLDLDLERWFLHGWFE